MLYVALVLVLIAAGLIVAGLITANTLWAWISVGVSVVAGIVMLVEWLRRRKRPAAAEPEADAPADEAVEGEVAGELPLEDEKEPATALIPAEGELADAPAGDDESAEPESKPAAAAESESEPEADQPAAETGDPGEEDTDAADLLVVSGLDVEVLVVDEYPRYHLADCTWLVERDTIPIAVAEARDLGFTPCDRCGPDAKLAAEHRDTRKKASK